MPETLYWLTLVKSYSGLRLQRCTTYVMTKAGSNRVYRSTATQHLKTSSFPYS